MNIYIIGGALLLALVAWLRYKTLKRRRVRAAEAERKRVRAEKERLAHWQSLDRKAKAWIAKIEAAETDEQIEAAEWPSNKPLHSYHEREYYQRFEAASSRYDEATRRLWQARRAEKFKSELAAASTNLERVKIAESVSLDGLQDVVFGLSKKQLSDLTVELALGELEQARQGDAQALRRFQILQTRTELRFVLGNEQQAIVRRCPDDWNDLVSRLIETPLLSDYNVKREPTPGAVRLMAAQALGEQSLTLGKIVLAYCSVREDVLGDRGQDWGRSRQAVWPFRQEIGDVLLAEVTKMVYALHTQHSMFVTVD